MQTSKTKESHNPPKKQNLNAQIGSTKETFSSDVYQGSLNAPRKLCQRV